MTAAISSFVPPVAPQAPAPQAPAPQAGEQSFAQMLTQTQQGQQAQQAAPEGADEGTEVQKPQGQDRTRTDNKAGKTAEKPRQPTKAEGAKAPAEGEKTTEASAEDKPEEAADAAAADPSLADWLAGLHLPPTTPQAPADGAAGREAGDPKARLAALVKGEPAEPGRAKAKGRDAEGVDAAASQKRDAAAVARDPKTLLAAQDAVAEKAMSGTERTEATPQPRFAQELQSLTAAQGAQATAAATPSRNTEAPASTVVQMPTPATSPEFTQSLGVQLSVLARDGIQQAELHLNPAEMGPISVQIALDGNQAQVNFGADLSATRQIIENGLPELAAALRDAGFTLSGGGVHSQARGQGEGGEGRQNGAGTPGAGSGEKEVTPARTITRVSAGGVDVYA